MAFSVGETLQAGKYHLDALIDARQWGMTFLATHLSVEQQVLIKTFRVADTPDGPSQAQVDSFTNYAKQLTRFHYPQLSRVSSVFEEHQNACMVSEYIQGAPLSQLIQDQPLEESIAIQSIFQVVQGLHALHRHGLLHLNLRPSRILKREDDGGIVLIGLNSRFSNHPEELEGKPYLALEQSQSSPSVGIASEIYGVAATLYTLVTGRVPVAACDRHDMPLPSPRRYCPHLSVPLEDAILRGLALDSRDRPQSLKAWLQMLPKALPEAAPKTTLQVPSAWKVKLPAFRDAGFKNSVSTVITSESQIESSASPVENPAKTTLQASAPEPVVPEPVVSQNVSDPQQIGHSELDSILADLSSTPAPSKTTLQVPDEPLVQSPVTRPQPAPVVSPDEAQLAIGSQEDAIPQAASPGAIPISSSHEKPSFPAAPESPAPVLTESSPSIQPQASNMTTAFPQKKSSRFPKWTLFWCALVAACSGLGAGLWFRVQIAQQFAPPAASAEDSPLDKLRSLDTKEEKFLPTNSSVIPEDKSEQNDAADVYDPNQEADLDLPSGNEYDAIDPNLESSPGFSDANESPSWNARERLSREQQELDLPVSETLEEFSSDSPESFDSAPIYDERIDPAIGAQNPNEVYEPDAPTDEFQSDNYPSDEFQSDNYPLDNTSPDPDSNTL